MYEVFYDGRQSGEYRLLKQAKEEAAFWASSLPVYELTIRRGNVVYRSYDDGATWQKCTYPA